MTDRDDPQKREAAREVVNAAIELVRLDDGPAFVRLKTAVEALLRHGWGEQLGLMEAKR